MKFHQNSWIFEKNIIIVIYRILRIIHQITWKNMKDVLRVYIRHAHAKSISSKIIRLYPNIPESSAKYNYYMIWRFMPN